MSVYPKIWQLSSLFVYIRKHYIHVQLGHSSHQNFAFNTHHCHSAEQFHFINNRFIRLFTFYLLISTTHYYLVKTTRELARQATCSAKSQKRKKLAKNIKTNDGSLKVVIFDVEQKDTNVLVWVIGMLPNALVSVEKTTRREHKYNNNEWYHIVKRLLSRSTWPIFADGLCSIHICPIDVAMPMSTDTFLPSLCIYSYTLIFFRFVTPLIVIKWWFCRYRKCVCRVVGPCQTIAMNNRWIVFVAVMVPQCLKCIYILHIDG